MHRCVVIFEKIEFLKRRLVHVPLSWVRLKIPFPFLTFSFPLVKGGS